MVGGCAATGLGGFDAVLSGAAATGFGSGVDAAPGAAALAGAVAGSTAGSRAVVGVDREGACERSIS